MSLGHGVNLRPDCRLLIWNLVILIAIPYSWAQFQIPSQLRVASDVEITNPNGSYATFSAEEFVDSIEGNVHMRLENLDRSKSGSKDVHRYYRIMDGQHNQEPLGSDDWLVYYSDSQQLCSNARLKEWELKDLSIAIDILMDVDTVKNTGQLKMDRTAIGPGTLLRFVSQNEGLFFYQDQVYDDDLLSHMHLFAGDLVSRGRQTLKMVIFMPDDAVEEMDDRQADMVMRPFKQPPSKIILIILEDGDPNVNINALGLVEMMPKGSTIIKIKYNSVEERSVSRQLGLMAGGSAFQLNPFSLPPGAGCGSSNNFLYVEATQFSGIFEANGVADSKRYIAYDESTGHLRIDSIDNHKLIYDLRSSLVTYVDVSDNRTGSICAQSYLAAYDSDDLFSKVKMTKDIIGFTALRGLIFLGRVILEDGSQCSVFEMKISHNQIPLILAMNMRIELANVHMLTVVFYFVDELQQTESAERGFAYQGLWLKRIELIGRHSSSRYNILNSQVTFSEFTWTLNSVDENEINRETSIRHPVRSFDLVQCQLTHLRRELELIMFARDGSDLGIEPTRSLMLSSEQVESVEEAAMELVIKQTSLARSQINELELITSPEGKSDWRSLQIRATLTEPLLLMIDKLLVGWVYTIDSIPFGKEGRLISARRMTRLECSMKLAAELVAGLKTVAMIYCPNLGCGFMRGLSSFEYVKKDSFQSEDDWPKLRDNFYLCEVYTQTRDVASSKYETNQLPDLAIEMALNGSFVSIVTGLMGKATLMNELPVFRGVVGRVSVTSGHHKLDSMGKLVRAGYCFTSHSVAHTKHANQTSMLMELKFGLHQSIVYCHKACLLQANCLSYSFDKSQRLCTMTNIPATKLAPMMGQIPLREDPRCAIYTRNPINSYAQVLDVTLNSLSGLSSSSEVDFFVASADLEDCTSLCHMDELNCRQFFLFPAENLCFLEDRSSVIFGTFFSPQEVEKYKSRGDKTNLFAHITGSNNWSGYHKSLLFKQQFNHIFDIKSSSKMRQLNDVNGDGKIFLKLDLDDGNKRVFELVTGNPIPDLDIEDCLRECAIIRPNCVIADHYFGLLDKVYTRVCAIYLLELVQDKGTSSARAGYQDADLLVKDPRSTHHRLSGDNLLLRMMLLVSADVSMNQSTFQKERESLVMEESNKNHGNYEGNNKTLERPVTSKPNQMPSSMSLLMLAFGAAIGLMASLLYGAGSRTERSLSEVNLHSEQFEMQLETRDMGDSHDRD